MIFWTKSSNAEGQKKSVFPSKHLHSPHERRDWITIGISSKYYISIIGYPSFPSIQILGNKQKKDLSVNKSYPYPSSNKNSCEKRKIIELPSPLTATHATRSGRGWLGISGNPHTLTRTSIPNDASDLKKTIWSQHHWQIHVCFD